MRLMKPQGVRDRFGTEISQETRRLLGVTPKLLEAYSESPAKFLPKGRGLKQMMGATRRKGVL